MALYLGQTDLDSLFAQGAVTSVDCIEAVQTSFLEQGREQVGVLPRQVMWAGPKLTAPRSRSLKISAAYMRQSRIMGASIYAVQYAPGGVDMWLTIFDGDTGQMLGVINSKQLSIWKTGATGGGGAPVLARPNAQRFALIGTGSYALAQLTFMTAIMNVERISCYSRNQDSLRAFCKRAHSMLGIEVLAAQSVFDAVKDADVVTTITTSPTPVLMGNWLPESVHCNVMGQHAPSAREVDTQAVLQSRVFVDALTQAINEKGELLLPIAEGALTEEHVLGELGAVLSGRCEGRRTPTERTMFLSGGTAFEYMGLCSMLLRKAAAAGIGHHLDP